LLDPIDSWIGGLAAAPDMTRAGCIFFLKPVIAAGLAMAILGESLSALRAGAIVVVTGSVFVEVFWPRIARLLGAQGKKWVIGDGSRHPERGSAAEGIAVAVGGGPACPAISQYRAGPPTELAV
jgi:hypothetical protein